MITFVRQCTLYLFVLTMPLISGCGEAPPPDTRSQLFGRWVLDRAYRNGQPTESLDELYFEFLPSGRMNTNLTGEPQEASYDLEEEVIRQREGSLDANYTIEEIGDTVLVLSTSLRNFSFRFHLRRQGPSE